MEFINAKTALTRVQFRAEKCHIMHIGKKSPEHKKMDIYVDNWKIQEIEDINRNTKEEEEVFDGEKDIHEVESTKYLGQIISQDGKNLKNIVNCANKGIGLVNKKHPRGQISL